MALVRHFGALAGTFVVYLWKSCYKSESGSHVWVRQAQTRVKAATDTLEPGQVVKTTTIKQVLPSDPAAAEKKTPDFWTYLENLGSEWERHLLYIYRRVSDSGPMVPLDKCSGYITMPDRTQVALNNREEVEFAIAGKFGGGIYRLILKRGSERVTEGKVLVEGAPKPVQPMADGSGPTVIPMSEAGATADIAHHAINTVANQDKAGMQMGMEAMGVALNVIKSAATVQPAAPPPPPSETDQMMKVLMMRMMEKMVDRMDAPASSPAPAAGNGSSSPIVEKILNTAVERMLNPPATGPVASAGAELVRTLPQVAGHVGEAIHEWRMGMEAQRETAAMMTGKAAPNVAQPARPVALPPPAPPAPAANPPEARVMPGLPSTDFIESKIVEILAEPLSADEAGEETFAFLDRLDPQLPSQLAVLGEAGLLQLFHARPILRQAAQNLPRLQEFIKAFLKYAQAEQLPGTAKPN